MSNYKARDEKFTWYTLTKRAPEEQPHKTTNQGHEIAIHTEANSYGKFVIEIDTLNQKSKYKVNGSTAHGG